MDALSAVDPRLMWEFGPAIGKPGHRLCITPESNSQLRPMLSVLLDMAPKLERWEFYPYRLPDRIGPDPVLIDGRTKISREGVLAIASRSCGNRIDVLYFLPDDSMADDNLAQQFAFYTTERLVGEEVLDKWIGSIGAASQKDPRFITSRRLPLERLGHTIGAVVQSIREQLPPVPWFAYTPNESPDSPLGGTFKLPAPEPMDDYPGWSDLMFASAQNVELWQACHGKGFYSERFSRCGETFCYLKIDRRVNPEFLKVAERAKIEDALTGALRSAEFGCSMGGGTGKIYSYVELALTDVRKSVPLVREVLKTFNCKRSWLLFHDRDLGDEWIGYGNETPSPPR